MGNVESVNDAEADFECLDIDEEPTQVRRNNINLTNPANLLGKSKPLKQTFVAPSLKRKRTDSLFGAILSQAKLQRRAVQKSSHQKLTMSPCTQMTKGDDSSDSHSNSFASTIDNVHKTYYNTRNHGKSLEIRQESKVSMHTLQLWGNNQRKPSDTHKIST